MQHVQRYRAMCLVILATVLPFFVQAQPIPSTLNSKGKIYNTGTVRIVGDAIISQDTIKGRVEYTRNGSNDSQLVAHITYEDLYFEGTSTKRMPDATRPVVSLTSFTSADAFVIFDLDPTSRIQAHGSVKHSGSINPGRRVGTMELNGTTAQDISGDGRFAILEINNRSNVNVISKGGFKVAGRLDLQRGTLTNTTTDNFTLNDDAWIWRSDSGALASAALRDARYNVRYYGSQFMLGGPELPTDAPPLRVLLQEDPGGLQLPWDVTVNDSVVLRGHIYTEDTSSQYTLTLTSQNDPTFIGLWPEVNGTLIRTNLAAGRTYVMNSLHSSVGFSTAAEQGNARAVSLRSKPLTVPVPTAAGTDKVLRFYQMAVLDGSNTVVPDLSYVLQFGYSWRTLPIQGLEPASIVETIPALLPYEDSLVLLRYVGDRYVPEPSSTIPTQRDSVWRYSVASGISNSGDFAIGLASSSPFYVLRARLLLEGAMRSYGENANPIMGTDLRQRNLVPATPPREYPFTQDPISSTILVTTMPDSVVDWMLVEFRSELTGGTTYYRTCLISSNGYVIDPTTFEPITITNITFGEYYVVFRHRNHLAVMTDTKERITPVKTERFLDLTDGTNVFGGASGMKLLGTRGGAKFFGMVAGAVSDDDDILRNDVDLVWSNRDFEGYSIFDTDLDGIISTKDLNISWNNRGRSSVVTR
ncbi:MAG: hypothetical protein JSS89_06855 [Bacteroidetes bacterium]|nr:hypothetical protein [Bacteroidota bacterium]